MSTFTVSFQSFVIFLLVSEGVCTGNGRGPKPHGFCQSTCQIRARVQGQAASVRGWRWSWSPSACLVLLFWHRELDASDSA